MNYHCFFPDPRGHMVGSLRFRDLDASDYKDQVDYDVSSVNHISLLPESLLGFEAYQQQLEQLYEGLFRRRERCFEQHSDVTLATRI